jgi:hypothetical protein
MNGGQKLVISFFICLGLGCYLWLHKEKEKPAPPSPAPVLVRSQVKLPEKRPSSVATEAAKHSTPDCNQYWNNFYAKNFGKNPNMAEVEKLLSSNTNCEPETAHLSTLKTAMETVCAKWKKASLSKGVTETNLKKMAKSCRLRLLRLQSELAELQTKGISFATITDRNLLAQKIMANFKANPKAAAEGAERLLELEPANRAAMKAAILSYFALATQNRSPASENWSDYSNSIKRLKSLEGNEGYFLRVVDIASKFVASGNKKALDAQIVQFQKEYPTRGDPYFFMALSQAKEGNRTEAIQLLNKAYKTEPTNLHYLMTLKRMETIDDPWKLSKAFRIEFPYHVSEVFSSQ